MAIVPERSRKRKLMNKIIKRILDQFSEDYEPNEAELEERLELIRRAKAAQLTAVSPG